MYTDWPILVFIGIVALISITAFFKVMIRNVRMIERWNENDRTERSRKNRKRTE